MNEKLALSGLSGAAVLAAGSMAYGAIVVVAPPAGVAQNGNTAFHGNSVAWDVDGDGTDDFEFGFRGTPISPTYDWQANVYVLDGGMVGGYAGAFVTYGTRLAAGDSVAGTGMTDAGGSNVAMGSDYGSTAYGGWGGVGTAQTGFLGFQLGGGNYGWIEVTAGPAGITFGGAAYEDTGADILAGAVPAPASLSMLALGAAGLLRRKR